MKKIFKNPWLYIFIYGIFLLIIGACLLVKPIKKIVVILKKQRTEIIINENDVIKKKV